MKLTRGTRTPDLNPGIGKVPPTFVSLLFTEAWLDTVFVRRSQFDRGKTDLFAYFEDGRNVPMGGDIVGHDSKPIFQRRLVISFSQSRSGSRNASGGHAARGLQETAAIDSGHVKISSVQNPAGEFIDAKPNRRAQAPLDGQKYKITVNPARVCNQFHEAPDAKQGI